MLKIILLGALWCAALPCHGQQAIEIRNFTAAQKAEWQRFMQTWTGNERQWYLHAYNARANQRGTMYPV